jgi:hypothetical protein
MKSKKKILLTCGIAALSTAASSAAVIISDSFNDGGITEGTDTQDVSWALRGNFGANDYGTAAALPGTGGYLQIAGNNNGGTTGLLPTNTALNISVGQTITLSFNFLFTNIGGGGTAGLRFGLTTLNGSGSYAQAGVGVSNTNVGIRYDANADGPTGANRFGGGGNNGLTFNQTDESFTDATIGSFITTATVYSASFSITRNASTLSYSSTVNGATATAVEVDNVPNTNNTIGNDYLTDFSGGLIVIRNATTTAPTLRIDNVVVEVIPEPSTALLGALGFLALLRRRR